MKAIKITLYTCSSLMLVAAVAGTLDYNTAQKNGSIKNLYKEEKPVVTNTHKEIDVEDYSRGEINRIPDLPPPPKVKAKNAKFIPPKIVEEKEVVAVKNDDYADAIIAVKTEEPKEITKQTPMKKKRLSYRSFSRGPLREDIIKDDEVVSVDTLAKAAVLTTEE